MKLSIITINFNNCHGLSKTIESVKSQTWRDFEWILIDGGSTDGSKDLIEKNEKLFAYWCSESDGGIYNAMNKGLAKAEGEYVNFMNSGDVFFAINTLNNVFNNYHKADILFGDALDESGIKTILKRNVLIQLLEHTFCHQGTFIRRKLFCDRIYDESLKMVADWKFFIEAIVREKATSEYLNMVVAVYEKNTTAVIGLNYFDERNRVLENLFSPIELNALLELKDYEANRPLLRTRLLIERGGWAERLTRMVLKLLDKMFLKIDFRQNGYVCLLQPKEKHHSKIYNRIRNAFFQYVVNPIAYRYTARYHIMDSMESIRYIIDHRCSVSRYGDGEFYVMMGKGNGFQRPNPKLGALLRHVLLADDAPNHMVGIPMPLKDTSGLIDGYPSFFWRFYTGRRIWFIRKFIKKDRTYLNTQLSRFFYEVRDKSHCAEHIALLKKIWEGRDIVIIEGALTRSGVGNDLYDNARSVKRILGPSTNAIDRYEELLAAVKTYVPKDRLVLLSLGMTATVLAYDLAKLGYQAIDLGHLDIEYEYFLRGEPMDKPIPIEGKFVNEAVGGGNNVADCTDPKYLSQILCNLS